MRSIRDFLAVPLRWSQDRQLTWEYKLRAGHEVAATLRFPSRLSSLALAESVDGALTLKRSGFIPKVTVRGTGPETEVAVFNSDWRSLSGEGQILFSNGQKYRWVNLSWLALEWAIADEAGSRLIHFFNPADSGFPFSRLRCDVEIDLCAAELPGLSILATLGCYLMVYLCWWQNCCRS